MAAVAGAKAQAVCRLRMLLIKVILLLQLLQVTDCSSLQWQMRAC